MRILKEKASNEILEYVINTKVADNVCHFRVFSTGFESRLKVSCKSRNIILLKRLIGETENESKRLPEKIFTIPNLLSLFRLCLIPVIIRLYCAQHNYLRTTLVLTISGITDIADGIIARKFHMISDFGKIFDPVADKLTQIAMLFCLVTRFPHMMVRWCCWSLKKYCAQ